MFKWVISKWQTSLLLALIMSIAVSGSYLMGRMDGKSLEIAKNQKAIRKHEKKSRDEIINIKKKYRSIQQKIDIKVDSLTHCPISTSTINVLYNSGSDE